MANQFGLAADFCSLLLDRTTVSLRHIDCINLTSFLSKNNVISITPLIIQQRIEQYTSDYCRLITNVHIHIYSNQTCQHAFEFIRQLKNDNPTIQVQISLDDELIRKAWQSVVVLTYEYTFQHVRHPRKYLNAAEIHNLFYKNMVIRIQQQSCS
ncbi:hypothetical protein I4U23_023227 [Adineta vaga]|nr:hypothetical protein I4U23_023227 [Adineta vaga]